MQLTVLYGAQDLVISIYSYYELNMKYKNKKLCYTVKYYLYTYRVSINSFPDYKHLLQENFTLHLN